MENQNIIHIVRVLPEFPGIGYDIEITLTPESNKSMGETLKKYLPLEVFFGIEKVLPDGRYYYKLHLSDAKGELFKKATYDAYFKFSAQVN